MNKVVKAVCYGEVLFDVFPDEERIGGAPLNVAARLSSLGINTRMISKIGADQKGEQIIAFLKEQGVETSNVLRDPQYSTGVVNVSLSKSGSATYEIAYPAAWDKIELTPKNLEAAKECDLFIFGSLVCRDEVSRNSLFELLEKAKYKVLDFNLRPPYYTRELLCDLINKADFIKFNDDELFEIAEILGSSFHSLEQNLMYIAENSSAKTICVTKGRHGAVLYRDGKLVYNSGFKIEVKDTVGAGDSFMAGLLAKIFQGENSQNALDFACALGALVAGEKGANPKLDPKKVKEFIYAPGFTWR
ncbi:carbohydrate kinase family protein [Salinimicrobium sp. TH3]|uniref:carbohydrate kinase family protein n=1 Tax=Salinimicrobium sp. TH3 TaxID=2997342 RepID=UPI002276F153|nr:carbohydrate kinase [Salinimicrobium sp. TH3]MCY2687974.1 carbohydrate kinase [Salinimicrobium sp. TH3]